MGIYQLRYGNGTELVEAHSPADAVAARTYMPKTVMPQGITDLSAAGAWAARLAAREHRPGYGRIIQPLLDDGPVDIQAERQARRHFTSYEDWDA
jgi:hypothetical protein